MTAMSKQLQGKVKAAILSKDYMQNGQQKYQFIVEFENGRRGRFVTLADKYNPKFKFKEGTEINYIHPKEDDDYAQIVYPKFNQVSNTNSGSKNNYEEKEIEMAKSDTDTNSSGPGEVTLTHEPMNQTEGMTRLNCNNAVIALVTSEAYQKLDEDGRNAMFNDLMEKSMILYINTIKKPKLIK